jgi:hypothetical protein
MLRSSVWILAIFLIVGQAFAGVTVYVDMKQTGPVDSNGEVQVRVGKNVNATYSATAGYNGQPTLHAEEEVTGESWTFSVSSSADVNYNPNSGNGNSVTVTASSAKAGTYTITVTFSLTFTIKTPQKDTQGNYVYDVNNNQLFTTRSDGPYSGSGSATLNVKDGKFEVKIKPNVLIPQYVGDTDGYRNKLGIGEDATLFVFPEEGSEDTVVFHTATSSDFWISGASFEAGPIAKQGTISVLACINGSAEPDGPETIGISVVEPGGAGIVQEPHSNIWHIHNTGSVGFLGMIYITPDDVSFHNVTFQERECIGIGMGYFQGEQDEHHPGTSWLSCIVGIDTTINKRNVLSARDTIQSNVNTRIPYTDGTFTWSIPWRFKYNWYEKNFTIVNQVETINASGDMSISKGGETKSATFGSLTNLHWYNVIDYDVTFYIIKEAK